jgi:hypothetical protein
LAVATAAAAARLRTCGVTLHYPSAF